MYLKAATIWASFIPIAIGNGLLREKGLAPLLGKRLALPLSGISGAFLFFLLTYLSIPWLGPLTARQYRLTGVCWLAMTVAFESAFGRLVAHKPWPEILAAYDPTTGNLWLLVLLAIAASPLIAGSARGYIKKGDRLLF